MTDLSWNSSSLGSAYKRVADGSYREIPVLNVVDLLSNLGGYTILLKALKVSCSSTACTR